MQNQIAGIRFLDLFAGSGAMGLEALSRGAEKVVFVEKNKHAVHCIKGNLESLGIKEGVEVLFKDVFAAVDHLKDEGAIFELIYVDPPYDYEVSFLLDSLAPILTPDGMVVVEQGKFTKLHCEQLQESTRKEMGDTILYFFVLKKKE